jgi:hypothetical protein
VAALEQLLKPFSREGTEISITGANLHIVNGLGSTDCGDPADPIPNCPNGLGNLIVGYNELRTVSNCGPGPFCANTRTGSHNIVVGQYHNYSNVGGLAVGFRNEISGDFASVSGGLDSRATGSSTAVSGGQGNTASGLAAAVSGGRSNTASGDAAVVSGGEFNTAGGISAVVGGGHNRTADGQFDWVAGSLLEDE